MGYTHAPLEVSPNPRHGTIIFGLQRQVKVAWPKFSSSPGPAHQGYPDCMDYLSYHVYILPVAHLFVFLRPPSVTSSHLPISNPSRKTKTQNIYWYYSPECSYLRSIKLETKAPGPPTPPRKGHLALFESADVLTAARYILFVGSSLASESKLQWGRGESIGLHRDRGGCVGR